MGLSIAQFLVAVWARLCKWLGVGHLCFLFPLVFFHKWMIRCAAAKMQGKAAQEELSLTMRTMFFRYGVDLGIKGCEGPFNLLIQLLFVEGVVAPLNTRLRDGILIEELVVLGVSGPR